MLGHLHALRDIAPWRCLPVTFTLQTTPYSQPLKDWVGTKLGTACKMLISRLIQGSSYRHETTGEKWSGRKDLNLRPPGPEPGALARLRYAPTEPARPHRGLERSL
jgi:hypothetical protein